MKSIPQDRGGLITAALVSLAGETSGTLNPYLRRHLSGHAARSCRWGDLEATTDVVDRLDVDALASDILQYSLGRTSLPVSIAATVSARDHICVSAQSDRPLLRQLAAACLAGFIRPDGAPGILRWAQPSGRAVLSVPLTGHTDLVRKRVVSGQAKHPGGAQRSRDGL